MKIHLVIILQIVIASVGFAQNPKEVLLIGTMHQVSKAKKNAYRPMLKKAIAYAPEAIYVERQMKEDTVSVKNYFPEFYAKADSLRKVKSFDLDKIEMLKNRNLNDLDSSEAKLLASYYYCQFDYANYHYYSYVSRFGVRSAGKRSDRTENVDLSIPLAIEMDIKEIRSMDNQTYYQEYQDNWRACDKASESDGEVMYFKKGIRKANFQGVWGFFFGLGKMVNKSKVSNLYHELNSFEYRKTSCEPCDKGNYYWDYRNTQMAKNIATQISQGGEEKSVVIVGAGHIYGLIEALERDYPELKIKLYKDL